MHYIDYQTAFNLYDYPTLTIKLLEAHKVPTDYIEDLLIESDHEDIKNHFFLRAAWQKNHYLGTKNITIFPQNRDPDGPPAIQALYNLFDGKTGTPLCCIDGTALTALKTATDSALAGKLLVNSDPQIMLMIGAGGMSQHLIEAHYAVNPSLKEILIWNRTPTRCIDIIDKLQRKNIYVKQTENLEYAIKQADLICSAVTTSSPYINGNWLKPGCHVDLVGSFTENLREADNEAIRRGSVFVDSRRMTLGVVGDIVLPISQGVMTPADIKADYYDIHIDNCFKRSSRAEITIFKNGGGGHLDLMMAQILYNKHINNLKG